MQFGEYASIDLVGFDSAQAIARTWIGLAIATLRTCGAISPTTAAVFPVASNTTLSSGGGALANATTASCSSTTCSPARCFTSYRSTPGPLGGDATKLWRRRLTSKIVCNCKDSERERDLPVPVMAYYTVALALYLGYGLRSL